MDTHAGNSGALDSSGLFSGNLLRARVRVITDALRRLPRLRTAFDHAFIVGVATRIINEVRGINRVVYDVTSKAPRRIEWA